MVSFGDEKPEAAPVIPMDQADSKKEADPDLDEGGLEFPADEDSDSRDSKRELKRKLREAKRQEKLDKKKKSRGADFQAGSDIDIFPEDEE